MLEVAAAAAILGGAGAYLGNRDSQRQAAAARNEAKWLERLRAEGMAADRARYVEALGILRALSARQEKDVKKLGKAGETALKRQRKANMGAAMSQATARGLGNTTVRMGLGARVNRDYSEQLANLRENITRLRMETAASGQGGLAQAILNRSEPIPGFDQISAQRMFAATRPNVWGQWLSGLGGMATGAGLTAMTAPQPAQQPMTGGGGGGGDVGRPSMRTQT